MIHTPPFRHLSHGPIDGHQETSMACSSQPCLTILTLRLERYKASFRTASSCRIKRHRLNVTDGGPGEVTGDDDDEDGFQSLQKREAVGRGRRSHVDRPQP